MVKRGWTAAPYTKPVRSAMPAHGPKGVCPVTMAIRGDVREGEATKRRTVRCPRAERTTFPIVRCRSRLRRSVALPKIAPARNSFHTGRRRRPGIPWIPIDAGPSVGMVAEEKNFAYTAKGWVDDRGLACYISLGTTPFGALLGRQVPAPPGGSFFARRGGPLCAASLRVWGWLLFFATGTIGLSALSPGRRRTPACSAPIWGLRSSTPVVRIRRAIHWPPGPSRSLVPALSFQALSGRRSPA